MEGRSVGLLLVLALVPAVAAVADTLPCDLPPKCAHARCRFIHGMSVTEETARAGGGGFLGFGGVMNVQTDERLVIAFNDDNCGKPQLVCESRVGRG